MTINYFDAIIVGSGFGGITSMQKLRDEGYTVKGFDRSEFLGGIWNSQRYPGLRVDSESPLYQLWLEETCKDFTFAERFTSGEELRKYFEFVDTKLDISKEYSFRSNVSAAHWNDESNQWEIEVTGNGAGKYFCKYLILCTGFAAKKTMPPLKNIDSFKGKYFHTSEWPWEGVDTEGKRVAVVGTGASGVQVIQEIGPHVKEMVVFQRTPNTAIPMRQRPMTKEEQDSMRDQYPLTFNRLKKTSLSGFTFSRDPRWAKNCTPEEIKAKFDECWEGGAFRFWEANFDDLMIDPESNKLAYEYWKEKTRQRIKDPRKAALLAPDKQLHPIFAKRPSLEQTYYEVYNQENVDIVDMRLTPIVEVTEKGIKTSEREYEFDIIIYATGFDALTGGFYQIDLRGENGISIKEQWKNGTFTYLGMSIANFPNMFFLYGPQGPSPFCNGPTCCLIQAEWIRDIVNFTNKNGYSSVSATEEAQQKYRKYINESANKTLVPLADSWYMGINREDTNVRECLLYVLGVNNYYADVNKEKEEGYRNFTFK